MFSTEKGGVKGIASYIHCKKNLEKNTKIRELKILTAHNPNTQSTTSIILTIIMLITDTTFYIPIFYHLTFNH